MKSERYKTLKIVYNNVRMNKKYLGRLIYWRNQTTLLGQANDTYEKNSNYNFIQYNLTFFLI